MGRPVTECESHVSERECLSSWIQSTAGHEESRGKSGGPPSKPKYYLMTDRGAVPSGKGEKNPGRGVKEYLKPCAYKQSKPVKG